ncbi:MAG: hypothetical protein V7K89_10265 [Nostoc sp.]
MFPDHGKTTDKLLQVVDQVLYAAKLHGAIASSVCNLIDEM